MVNMMWTAFAHIFLLTALMSIIIYRGTFTTVFTENGDDHYAEKNQHWKMFPEFVTMPLNTFINFFYVAIGAIWLAIISNKVDDRIIDENTAYFFHGFNWLSIFYGPMQCLRIITQIHEFAVLDQWYTLPFFTWLMIFLVYINFDFWDRKFAVGFMSTTLLSYGLALLWKDGFEYALGAHILLVITCGVWTVVKNFSRQLLFYAVILLFCNAGFVVLKVYDLHLPKIHEIFTIFSGHFLSKIADCMQIYWANMFVLTVIVTRKENMENTPKKTTIKISPNKNAKTSPKIKRENEKKKVL